MSERASFKALDSDEDPELSKSLNEEDQMKNSDLGSQEFDPLNDVEVGNYQMDSIDGR